MRVTVKRQYGETIGRVAGTVVPVLIEEPELIPYTSEIGARAGRYAEELIKKHMDSCECMDEILKNSEGYSRYQDLSEIFRDLRIRLRCS